MYQAEKAAQAAAYLLAKAPESRLGRLKLMKLLYLADRQAFANYGRTITGDRMVSMQHGPALSSTLNQLQSEGDFTQWVTACGSNHHEVAAGADLDSADLLSRADRAILDAIWARFGDMHMWDLRNWTHDPANCPEWEDPNGSSRTISLEALGRALGIPEQELAALIAENAEQQHLQEALASL